MIRGRQALAVVPAGLPLAAVLALAPVVGQRAALGPIGMLGAFAVALYALAVALPLGGALPWALGLLGIEYLASLQVRAAPLDLAAPAYAAALLLCAELGWVGLEARRGGRPWAGRALAVAALALAGAVLGALLLLVWTVPLPGGAPLTGLGVAATVAVAACLAWLGRR